MANGFRRSVSDLLDDWRHLTPTRRRQPRPVSHTPPLPISSKAGPLVLCPVRDIWKDEVGDVQYFYDEMQQAFLLYKEGAFYYHSFDPQQQAKIIPFPYDLSPLIHARLSKNGSMLGVQRSSYEIELFDVTSAAKVTLTFQTSKQAVVRILGFIWSEVDAYDLAVITSMGLELFKVSPLRNSSKSVKQYSYPTVHYLYEPKSSLILLCTGKQGAVLQGFFVRSLSTAKSTHRLPKFELDTRTDSSLKPEELSLVQIYERVYLVQIDGELGRLTLYRLSKDQVVQNPALELCVTGKFGLSVVDNLLVVHHPSSQVSLVYDVKHSSPQYPIVNPLPLTCKNGFEIDNGHLYDDAWQYLHSNFIFDGSTGSLWQISLALQDVVLQFTDKLELVYLLIRRSNCKPTVVSVIRNLLHDKHPLPAVSKLFNMLNSIYRAAILERAQMFQSRRFVEMSHSLPVGTFVGDPGLDSTVNKDTPTNKEEAEADGGDLRDLTTSEGLAVILQADVYHHVFAPLAAEQILEGKYLISVILEYNRSLLLQQLPPQNYIQDLLVDLLIDHKQYFQLHQLLQYHVINDSPDVAHRLLILGGANGPYRPVFQAGLDMLVRLQRFEDVIEALLKSNKVMEALSFLQRHPIAAIAAKRFLRVAAEQGDPMLLYTVTRFFLDWDQEVRIAQADARNLQSQFGVPYALLPAPCLDECDAYLDQSELDNLRRLSIRTPKSDSSANGHPISANESSAMPFGPSLKGF
eukprot:GILK01008548.1.p1 GENE.GILK01008548.1~~GILK01008548.1.p1  ORF type:complete len:762 (-),score=127.60 GILK01008548.1:63-2297(-)